jgi:hypothetical protein
MGPAVDFSGETFDERLISIAARSYAIVEDGYTPTGFVTRGSITIGGMARSRVVLAAQVCKVAAGACLTVFAGLTLAVNGVHLLSYCAVQTGAGSPKLH